MSPRFYGLVGRSGPLTMAQANMVRCVENDPPEHMNFRVIRDLPSGTTLAMIDEAVTQLVTRHESLRTVFHDDRQHVLAEGVVPVSVHRRPDTRFGTRPDAGTDAGTDAGFGVRFDLAREIPLRVGVVLEGGVPQQVTLVTTHSAVDAIGLAVLVGEWDQLILGKPLPPVTAPQPLDVATAELTPAALRRAEAALRYWEQNLRRVPRSALTVTVDDAGHHWRLPRLRVRSVPAADALGAIVARTGVSRSGAVLAALATLAGLRAGLPQVAVLSISANRFRPELRQYVGPLAQDALMPVDLSAATFDGVLAGVRQGVLAAYQSSRFDAGALLEIMDRVQRERGVFFARDLVFNDMSTPGRGGRVNRNGPAVRSSWLPEATLPARLSLWVNRLEGELDLTLWADPRCLPRTDARALGEGIAHLLIASATHDVPLSEIPVTPVPRGPGWVMSDNSWVDLASVEALVTDAQGRPAKVTAHPDPLLGHRLTCDAAPHVRPACQDLLPGRMSAMVPHDFTG